MPRKVPIQKWIIQVINFEEYTNYNKSKTLKWWARPHNFLRNPHFVTFNPSEKLMVDIIFDMACESNCGQVEVIDAHLCASMGIRVHLCASAIKKLNDIGIIRIICDKNTPYITEQNSALVSLNKTGHSIVTSEKPADRISPLKLVFDFEIIYQKYPKRKGHMNKKKGMSICNRIFNTQDLYDRLTKSVNNFADYCKTNNKIGTEFIPMWSTYLNGPWDEWVNPESVAAHDPNKIDWKRVFGEDYDESQLLPGTT